MKINTYLLVALCMSFVAPLSINAQKPKVADHYERSFVEVKELNQEKSDTKEPLTESRCPAPWLIREISKVYGVHYLVSFYTMLAHEYGHALSAKLLLGCKSNIYLFPKLIGVEGVAAYYFDDGTFPIDFNKGYKRAMVSAAGPLAGLAAGYGMLKLYTICSEYFDESKSLKDSIRDGLKKPVLHEQQSGKLVFAVMWSSLIHVLNLIPINDGQIKTDGAQILDALK
jgi:hypothetical protein